MVTQLRGFANPVHDAQRTFRQLLNALAHPGRIYELDVELTPPQGLSPASAAAALTLLDLETRVWAEATLSQASRDWLLFHTGCGFTASPQAANFALVTTGGLRSLTDFNWGQPEYPEASTTLLLQVPSLTGGTVVTLRGPGIAETCQAAPTVPETFWQDWRLNQQAYPLGVDVFIFSQNHVLGLPRTARIQLPAGA
jgi:alpha-D-ribose 1-methylphosphonate 5-triphosphate synthase subunit PhnH